MPETVVPYLRFLEIRQRRQRVAAELARRPGSSCNGESSDGEPLTIDCEALGDEHCGTRTQAAVVLGQKSPSA